MVIGVITLIVLFMLGAWMFYMSYPLLKSAVLDYVIHEIADISFEVEPTLVRSIGLRLRYLNFCMHYIVGLIGEKIENRFRKSEKDIFKNFHLPHRPWRFEPFFPSFSRWLYEERAKKRGMRRVGVERNQDPGRHHDPTEKICLIGSMKLPNRVYVGNSCILDLSFVPEFLYTQKHIPKYSVEKMGDNVIIKATYDDLRTSMEISLIGVGIEVKALGKEEQLNPAVNYSWGCYFPNSGIQVLVLKVEIKHRGHDSCIINTRLTHNIKVVQFDHLTALQVRVLAGAICLISAFLGGAVALNTLGVL